jgi:hypothetical protein
MLWNKVHDALAKRAPLPLGHLPARSPTLRDLY